MPVFDSEDTPLVLMPERIQTSENPFEYLKWQKGTFFKKQVPQELKRKGYADTVRICLRFLYLI